MWPSVSEYRGAVSPAVYKKYKGDDKARKPKGAYRNSDPENAHTLFEISAGLKSH